MNEPIPPYHDRVAELAVELAERGSQGWWSSTPPAWPTIEDEYGADAYDEVRSGCSRSWTSSAARTTARGHPRPGPAARAALRALPGPQAPPRPTRHGGRRQGAALAAAGLAGPQPRPRRLPLHQERAARSRSATRWRCTTRSSTRSASCAARSGRRWTSPPTHRRAEQLLVRERLLDIILRERVITAYQPIMDLEGPHRARLRGPVPRAAGLRAGERGRALRRRRPPPPARRAGPPLPPARPALLGAHPVQRQDLREHAARDHPRPAVPRPGAHRLPGQGPGLARPHRHRDHGEAGHRQLQPLPRGHGLLHRPRDVVRGRRRGRRLLGPGVHRAPEAAPS